jgi:hypothetical protein
MDTFGFSSGAGIGCARAGPGGPDRRHLGYHWYTGSRYQGEDGKDSDRDFRLLKEAAFTERRGMFWLSLADEIEMDTFRRKQAELQKQEADVLIRLEACSRGRAEETDLAAKASGVPEIRKPFDVLAEGLFIQSGRGDRIRTCDLLTPSQARYQTAPRPDDDRIDGISNVHGSLPPFQALASWSFHSSSDENSHMIMSRNAAYCGQSIRQA